ncbi:MAG: fused response regulator/phosphatase [Magnetococcales bacterium]|nr:fused response regulator/phosphatase [Magnetococcales bacterium]
MNRHKKKVLLIDDDPFDIDMLRNILGSEYALTVALNGTQGLKLAQAAVPPDLMLLDVMMPEMNGYEVCQRIKAIPDIRTLPIIFITAKSSAEDETHGLELGAVDYITKPFTPSVVQARVRTHLALRSAHRSLEAVNDQLLTERQIVVDIVANIQRSKPFDDRHLRCLNKPLETISGDLILSAFRPDGGQHVMLGDFTGHGLAAAIGGPLVSDTFYTDTLQGVPMETICARINHKLYRILRRDMFMVSCFLELNPERTRLKVWNCGLHDAFLFRGASLCHALEADCFPRGMLNQPDGAPQTVEVRPGDRVFIYSDGIVEERNDQDELFGTERLRTILGQISSQSHPLDGIMDLLERFRGERAQSDDISLAELTC